MIAIDTHVWIWWVDDNPRLKREVRDRFDREDDVRVSAISLVEIATAHSLGRLVLKPSVQSWLQVAQSAQQIRMEPLTDARSCFSGISRRVSSRSSRSAHRGFIARTLNAELVTADHRILAYKGVTTIAAE